MCSRKKNSSAYSNIGVTKIKDFDVIPTGKDSIINPSIIRYNEHTNHLFIYDGSKQQILEIDKRGNIIKRYGRRGRGPGEFLDVNNIFIVNNYLYVVDPIQLKISRFKVKGRLDATFNYGKGKSHVIPPPTPRSLEPKAEDINNQPVITRNGNVLLPTIGPQKTVNSLYKLKNWGGGYISNIGHVPTNSVFTIKYDKYKAAIHKNEVPDYYRAHAFVVSDRRNVNEFYLIYSAFPKIAKYSATGERRWETNIPETAELDSITRQFYKRSEKIRGHSRIELKKYVEGVSNDKGHLYLALGKYNNGLKGLWIHEFDSKGNLIQRYKLISHDTSLAAIFAIEVSGRRIFVVTKKARIRAYSF